MLMNKASTYKQTVTSKSASAPEIFVRRIMSQSPILEQIANNIIKITPAHISKYK